MTFAEGEKTGLSVPRRVHLALVLALCAAFSVYGSWVPFHFASKSFSLALADFCQTRWQVSRSDWAANLLLFLPVGFFGSGVCLVDRGAPGGYRILTVLLVTGVSSIASVLLEFSQEWFPERIPSFSDIGAQTVGAFWGGMAWAAGGQSLIDWLRRFAATFDADQRLNNVLVMAVAAYVLSLALPLDLIIRPSDLWDKFKAGEIRLQPFQNMVPETAQAWLQLPLQFGGSVLAGWLMMRLGRSQERTRARWGLQLTLGGLIFCSILEFMQLLVFSRSCKVDDVILGTLAFVAGGVLLPGAHLTNGAHYEARSRVLRGLLLATFLVWVGLYYWWPFDITLNSGTWLQRGKHFFQLPFLTLLAGSYANASMEILNKTLLFAMLSILIADLFAECRQGRGAPRTRLLAAFGASLLDGILIEVGQVAIPERTADMTDVILFGVGAAGGAFLAGYLQGAKVGESQGAMIRAESRPN